MAKWAIKMICGVLVAKDETGEDAWVTGRRKWRHRGGKMLELWVDPGVWIPAYSTTSLWHAVGVSEGIGLKGACDSVDPPSGKNGEEKTGQTEHAAL